MHVRLQIHVISKALKFEHRSVIESSYLKFIISVTIQI